MSSLIGNARAVAAVKRALAGDAPPHAWLIVGPEGVGKATLACWLAQVLNCERNVDGRSGVRARYQDGGARTVGVPRAGPPSGSVALPDASPLQGDAERRAGVEPCGECSQCDRIARGIHADVMTVTIPPAEDGVQHKEISVDQIRDVERAVALAPFEGRTRVVIIDPADRLSTGAQNAFLKTLEEPPPNAVFVLVAAREDALLPTVRSRCRRFEFGLVPAAEIEQALLALSGSKDPDLRIDKDLHIAREKARLLSRLAMGRPGRALEMAADPSRLEKRRQALEQASALGGMPMADLMDLSDRLSRRFREHREDVLERLSTWLAWWRDVLLVQSGAADGVTAVDLLDTLGEDASRYKLPHVVAFVQALVECRERLESNVQARIALDALVVRAPRGKAPANTI